MKDAKIIMYETFPEDPWISAYAMVSYQGKAAPYFQKRGKEGQSYGGWHVTQALKNGQKVKIPGFMLDSNFEQKALEAWIERAMKSGDPINYTDTPAQHQPPPVIATQTEFGTFSGQQQKEVGVDDGNLPF